MSSLRYVHEFIHPYAYYMSKGTVPIGLPTPNLDLLLCDTSEAYDRGRSEGRRRLEAGGWRLERDFVGGKGGVAAASRGTKDRRSRVSPPLPFLTWAILGRVSPGPFVKIIHLILYEIRRLSISRLKKRWGIPREILFFSSKIPRELLNCALSATWPAGTRLVCWSGSSRARSRGVRLDN